MARTILQAAWHNLKKAVGNQERGGDYFDHLDEEKMRRHLVKRLEKLGYAVRLEVKPATA